MFYSKLAIAVLGVASLVFGPAATIIGGFGAPAAYAKGGNGGGNGGGGGGSDDSSSKSDRSSGKDKASRSNSGSKSSTKKQAGKSTKATGGSSSKKSKSTNSTTKTAKSTKSKAQPKAAEVRPKARDLGNMNGALHANINAVLAHIRNGNLNGPVGLLAGLAVADSAAATAQAEAIALANLADAHDALSAGLSELGFDSVSEYLAAVEAGDVKEEDIARVSGLIDAAGGLNSDGTELATTRPTDEELTAAETAAAEGRTGVTDAEQAIIDAWNKEGDEAALLASLRERLVGNEAEIAAAIAEAEARDEATATAETDQSEDPADL